ncbi:hypothetical protein N7528_009213 [Penicillium herquei]|nr:hypothetical protein N7528_009213 [Penicillium herquei]
MDKGPQWITPSVLPGILEITDEEEIDIVQTENESESEDSQTESDRAFVVPDEECEPVEDNDYEPPEAVCTTSSDEEDVSYGIRSIRSAF